MIIKRGTKWNLSYPYPAPPPENPRWSKDGNGKSSLAPSDQCHSYATVLEIGKSFGIYLETLYIEFRALFQLYKCINPCTSMWGEFGDTNTTTFSRKKRHIYQVSWLSKKQQYNCSRLRLFFYILLYSIN